MLMIGYRLTKSKAEKKSVDLPQNGGKCRCNRCRWSRGGLSTHNVLFGCSISESNENKLNHSVSIMQIRSTRYKEVKS